jgi:hypothetical protein
MSYIFQKAVVGSAIGRGSGSLPLYKFCLPLTLLFFGLRKLPLRSPKQYAACGEKHVKILKIAICSF